MRAMTEDTRTVLRAVIRGGGGGGWAARSGHAVPWVGGQGRIDQQSGGGYYRNIEEPRTLWAMIDYLAPEPRPPRAGRP